MKTLQFQFKKLLLALILASLSTATYAQKISKVITHELAIDRGATISINGPDSMRITGKGRINTRHLEGKYVVSGRDPLPHVYVINKDLMIKTWDKNTIKQTVSITLEGHDPDISRQLLDNLDIILEANLLGDVELNFNLNIKKFNINNSFFGKDNNSVILNNNKEYLVKYLALKTELTIPRNSKLKVDAKHSNIYLEEHQGEIVLDMWLGGFYSHSVNDLQANLHSAKVEIDLIKNAQIKLKNSTLTIEKTENLALDSSMSKINVKQIDLMTVKNSVNDEFKIDSIGNLNVSESLFSDFQINSVTQSLKVDQKNTDLSVKNFNNSVTEILITNKNAEIDLSFAELSNYQLITHNPESNHYSLPLEWNNQVSENENKNENLNIYLKGNTQSRTLINLDCSQCNIVLN